MMLKMRRLSSSPGSKVENLGASLLLLPGHPTGYTDESVGEKFVWSQSVHPFLCQSVQGFLGFFFFYYPSPPRQVRK